MRRISNVGGIFSYITSRWALATFTVAILLNRTQFYASSRIPLSFTWHVRLAIYLLPILALICQIQYLLQAVRCQTSPAWPSMRYNLETSPFSGDMGGEGGLLYRISSTLIYWEDDLASCSAVNMALPDNTDIMKLSGSLVRLWPAFVTFCASQFVETMSCALQGRQPMPEVGMTLFEHSLAYSETEAMIAKPWETNNPATITRADGTVLKLSRGMMLPIMNVPPEVLVMTLVSAFSHLSSNILAVVGLRNRYRLVNTAIWGIAYMATFIWTFMRVTGTLDAPSNDLMFFRIPTVCIVGFIPHVIIIIGLSACAFIYGLAILITASSLPPAQEEPLTLRERFVAAYNNLSANVHFSGSTPITISWQDDFYTALLKVGYTVLCAASEAVFLNEGTRIRVSELTWLEEERLQELYEGRKLVQKTINAIPSELRHDFVAEGVAAKDVHDDNLSARSGYAKERTTRGQSSLPDVSASGADNGVGLYQRRGRWMMTFEFTKGIFWLLAAMNARIVLLLMEKSGISSRPQWLMEIAGVGNHEKMAMAGDVSGPERAKELDFWMLSEKGKLMLPPDDNVDVEVEMRRRLEYNGRRQSSRDVPEDTLNSNLYQWWKNNGWWGEADMSGSYAPSAADEDDDDTTSVLSMSTNATTSSRSSSWSSLSSGQRTPTQDNPFPRQSHRNRHDRARQPLDDHTIDPTHLARLLDPRTDADQQEAQLLASHLRSPTIMTRSQYRASQARDRARLLTSSHHLASTTALHGSATLSPTVHEARALERFILERRSRPSPSTSHSGPGGSWDSGAAGMGEGGPQCVVCQCSPRTVLVWPCGCLSLCDDCRLGLATRNFDKCVCCRGDVRAFSRLFVP
ncbi:hypothetical protein K490DRAFT_51839 [Saccharata proteae CBS 121410]|uniref:Ubiquitin-protein ligase-like protein n=1 Tax=Saccharata proteae CBS 121410 TaxID=1314787 RepID=A0A9P4HKQ7_9PEZI|nr:hypothetical protein K490DRAFT_51839 [Saccharata proteae CBS 121410]